MNPPTPADLALVRRLIETRAPADTRHDWLVEALGLEPYESPGYHPHALARRGTRDRTHAHPVTRTRP